MTARSIVLNAILLFLLGSLTPAVAEDRDVSGADPALGADQFQINIYTTAYQEAPAVAGNANGTFVVVWQSYGSAGTDSDYPTEPFNYSVQGRRYSSNGTALGEDFQINTYTPGNQWFPDVGVAANGDFTVVWASSGSGGTDSSSNSVQGQRYSSDGSALGAEFQVNSYTTASQSRPAVAVEADGDFIVVWTSGVGGTDSSSSTIQGQRYSSDGSPRGAEFQIKNLTSESQVEPTIAVEADGDFIIVWTSNGSDGTDSSSTSIQGQRYSSDGLALGTEFQVNSYTTEDQREPDVAINADGDFMVVWQSDGSGGTDSSLRSIQGQRYSSDGLALGTEFQVNSYTTASQSRPTVAVDAAGNFVVVWHNANPGSKLNVPYSVKSQRYASDGSPLGDEFQINTETVFLESFPDVTVNADGTFVVVWANDDSEGTDSSYTSIQGRQLTPPFFSDGFESGDTLAWSKTEG